MDYLISAAASKIQGIILSELVNISTEFAKNLYAHGISDEASRRALVEATETGLAAYGVQVRETFIKQVSSVLNTAFTSDATSRAGIVKWSKRAPIADADLSIVIGPTTLRDLWTTASRATSNLYAVMELDRVIEDSKFKNSDGQVMTLFEAAQALVRFSDLSTWGIERSIRPVQTNFYEILSKEYLDTVLQVPRATVKRGAPAEESLRSTTNFDVLTLYTLPYAHLAYEFSLGPTTAFHHGLYIGDSVMIEVQNIIIDGHVTSVITPSTLVNFMYRASSAGISGVWFGAYSQEFPAEAVRARALWAVGRNSYDILLNNCENLVSWVLTNNNSNKTCTMARAAMGLGPKRQMAGGRRR